MSENKNQNSVTCPSNHETSPGILKLDMSCFAKLLDWLSLAELKILRKTCKQLNNMINYHIKMHYPTVRIGYRKVEHFRDIEPTSSDLIKEIRLLNFKQKFHKEFEQNKQIMNHVESVRLFKDCVDGEFYDVLLKFCPNLKVLTIARIRDDTIIGSTNEWLLRSYPQLENLKFLDFLETEGTPIVELNTFFKLNPNILNFSTSLQFLKVNGKCLMGIDCKLDQLCIIITAEHYHLINDVIELLIELYRHGFYQYLYLYLGCLRTIDNVNYDKLVAMPALGKIRIPNYEQLILPLLPRLNELKIGSVQVSSNWETLSQSLVNVERVYIEKGSSTDIEPFIRHFKKLKHIKVGFHVSRACKSAQLNENRNQNLSHVNYLLSLNERRKKLIGACKTTIYVDEKLFLAIKWTSTIDHFDFVEFKRSEAFEWNNRCWYELNDGEDKPKSG